MVTSEEASLLSTRQQIVALEIQSIKGTASSGQNSVCVFWRNTMFSMHELHNTLYNKCKGALSAGELAQAQ